MNPPPPPPIRADNFAAWSDWARGATARTLDELLPADGGGERGDARLARTMRTAALDGGKRLRPLLCLASAQALAGEVSTAALRAAAAVEMIHCYSLIHDDLPCMDDDDVRRGRPACHIQFGEAAAVLAGDCLQSCAYAAAAANGAAAVAALAEAAGFAGLCGGQALDLAAADGTDEAMLIEIHARKTGALFRAALRLGALAGGGDEDACRRLDAFGAAFGRLFQIADDFADDGADRTNFVTALGKEAAAAAARGRRREAGAALDGARFPTAHLRAAADAVAANAVASADAVAAEAQC